MESLSYLRSHGIYSSRLNKNGERLAHSREEDDVGDEAPRHLQEGRWPEEGDPGGEEDVQEVVRWPEGEAHPPSPSPHELDLLSNH